VLSQAQRAEFEERGLLRLPGLVDARVVGALRDRILEHLCERGLVPDPVPSGFIVHPSRTASVARAHGFEEVWGAAVLELLDEMLGRARWQRPKWAGQVLALTFPRHGAVWSVAEKSWHLDYMAPSALRSMPGLQLFLCLDSVERHAGGTLVACGTHRLIDALRRRQGPGWPGRSADVRGRIQAAVPWLRELTTLRANEDREARFMGAPTLHEGIPLQVVELAGEPGDVFAMHPWLLHTAAPNCGARPRMVLTERLHASPL
jgi:ectoine hydroxylase-related dioxygenase (phytanoyl-CoA dioxygenase family)